MGNMISQHQKLIFTSIKTGVVTVYSTVTNSLLLNPVYCHLQVYL